MAPPPRPSRNPEDLRTESPALPIPPHPRPTDPKRATQAPPPPRNLALDQSRGRRFHRHHGHPPTDLTTPHETPTTTTPGPSKTRTAAPRGTPTYPPTDNHLTTSPAALPRAPKARLNHPHERRRLIRLSVNEFRRLFVGLLLTTTTTPAKLLAWSRWRRQHQARARTSHYQRREHQ